MWWRRLIKWFCITVLAVVVLALIVVWPVLGVNPFEGAVDHLWMLTSNKVEFFIRIPPVTVLDDEPLIGNLEQTASYSFFTDLREQILQATLDLARDVNPQVPMGLFEVDLKKDFLSKEMAVGGTIQRDFGRPRFDNFILLTRVPFYARFISALKRGFVRDRIQTDGSIDLVNGLYFKLQLGPAVANALRPYRTPTARGAGGDQTFYMVRIADVVLFSDNARWIEDALSKGTAILKADAWFEAEFIQSYQGGNRVEVFVRPTLTHRLMYHHAPRGSGGVLGVMRSLLPVNVMGELTLRLAAQGEDQLEAVLTNALTAEGFDKLPPHLQALYESEKGDPQFDLSENGIARFVPRRNTVGAAVIHIRAEHLVDLVVNMLGKDEIDLLDDEVRNVSRKRGRNYPSFRALMLELTKDLGSTHLLIAHRPKVFQRQRYDTLEDESDPPLPTAGLMYTLVSSIKESVRPDKVREKIFQHLQYIGMNATGPHRSGKFHTAQFLGDSEALVRPAYGVLGDKRFIVISSHVEGAEAVFRAAGNPDEQLIGREGLASIRSRLPRSASVSLIFDGPTIKAALFDRVRLVCDRELNLDQRATAKRNDIIAKNKLRKKRMTEDEIDAEVAAWYQAQVYDEYPRLRSEYLVSLGLLDPVHTIVGFGAFGVGAEKRVEMGAIGGFLTVSE